MFTIIVVAAILQEPLQFRWVYLQTNLQVDANVTKAKELFARAARAGYNGVVVSDVKLEFLSKVSEKYKKNAAELLNSAQQNHLELIPCTAAVGYAEGMLANDPNLAESQPVRGAKFVVEGKVIRFEADPAISLANGGFEERSGDSMTGFGFQDEPGKLTFADLSIRHSGTGSLRMEPGGTNTRIYKEIVVQPHRLYHGSAWVRSEALTGQLEMKVLDGNGKSLCEQSAGVERTQDWKLHHVVFNSGDSKVARLYCGFWGEKGGKLWLDDWNVEEVGPVNLVRRSSCPIKVRTADGRELKEGLDFGSFTDPHMGTVPWPGGYEVYHPAPTMSVPEGSTLRTGDVLRADYNTATVLRDGQVSICLNDPKTRDIIAENLSQIQQLWHPSGFFLSHDEIRSGGWCDGCQATGKTAGKILAENIAFCAEQVVKVRPGANVFVWSDMFDPFHNAKKDYYLTRGTLEGSWEGLPKSAIIVDWFFAMRDKNIPFFADRGHRQILAGYYDEDPKQIATWLQDSRRSKGIVGVMYTTWKGDYSQLEAFAIAAWGKN